MAKIIADLPLSEGVGLTTYDRSGGENHGTLVGGVSWVTGRYRNKALLFNGSTGYVNVPHTANIVVDTEFSLGVILKFTTVAASKNILGRQSGANPDILLRLNGASKFEFQVKVGGTLYLGTAGIVLVAGTWYRILCTYKSAVGLRMWIDTVEQGAAVAATGTVDDAAVAFTIGQVNSNFANVTIQDVYLADFAITPDAISLDNQILHVNNLGDGLSPIITESDVWSAETMSYARKQKSRGQVKNWTLACYEKAVVFDASVRRNLDVSAEKGTPIALIVNKKTLCQVAKNVIIRSIAGGLVEGDEDYRDFTIEVQEYQI